MNKVIIKPFNVIALYVGVMVITLFIGGVDLVTGYEFNFFVFYYISIALIAWYSNIYFTIAISVFSIVIWLVADIFAGHNYLSIMNQIWNTLIRFISFLVVALSIAKLKVAINNEKKISDDLREALNKVKTLEGLLPICASCKKIRLEKEGYWEQVEEYISRHSNLKFTHGICEDCIKELYPDLCSEKEE